MKKNLLLMMLCCPVILAAQNGVTVSGLAVDARTVTFNVSWDRDAMPVALWSDTVWVFVDYNDAGVMKRLPVTDASVSAGTVTKISNNDKGVWVEGNARTNDSFSAKVELFTEIKDIAGACAYASNYPPVGEYKNNVTEISFTGTPEYKVVLERNDITTYTTTVGKDESLLIPSSEVVLSFTDKTGAPGIILGGIFQQQGSCTYTEPAVVGTFANFDPSYSAATYVSLTDERDNKNYPVLKMGDRWIMARNLNYQKNLTWQANSADPSTGIGSNTALIGNFWCPGTSSAMTSTQASCEVYGALYSWETAMVLDGTGTWVEDIKANTVASAGTYNHGRTAHNGAGAGGRGICPPNWHVPTDFEWGVFFDAVEGSGTGTVHQSADGYGWFGTDASPKSKSACIGSATDSAPLWTMSKGNEGEDAYGFRVLPTGARTWDGLGFFAFGSGGWFWSSSVAAGTARWHRVFDGNSNLIGHWSCESTFGLSIRCIRDL